MCRRMPKISAEKTLLWNRFSKINMRCKWVVSCWFNLIHMEHWSIWAWGFSQLFTLYLGIVIPKHDPFLWYCAHAQGSQLLGKPWWTINESILSHKWTRMNIRNIQRHPTVSPTIVWMYCQNGYENPALYFFGGVSKGLMMTVHCVRPGWVYPHRWAELTQLQTRLVAPQHWHGEPGLAARKVVRF